MTNDRGGPCGTLLALQTIPGRTYTVEAVNRFAASGAWQAVGQVTATTNVSAFTDPDLSSDSRFWRYHPSP